MFFSKIDNSMDQNHINGLAAHYINVIFCGSNYWDIIPFSRESCKRTSNYYEAKHPNLGWSFYLFEGFEVNTLKSMKAFIESKCSLMNQRETNNVIVCRVDELLKERLLSLIRVLSQIFPSMNQPRVLIATQLNDTEAQMREMIERAHLGYDIDDIIKLKIQANAVFKVFYALFKASCYLNQLGDEVCFPIGLNGIDSRDTTFNIVEKDYLNRFNIILLGNPGSGRSTFINNTFNEKRSLARKGMPVTKSLIQYKHKNQPIALYDSKGFETEEETNSMLKSIENFSNEQRKNNKDSIHLVLYFINSQATFFSQYSLTFIKKLSSMKIPIFFLLTRCSKSSGQDSKKTALHTLSSLPIANPQVFPIDQQNRLDNGVKQVYRAIYAYYSQYKYDYEIISQLIDKFTDQVILDNIKNSFFFKHISKKDDLLALSSNHSYTCLIQHLLAASLCYGIAMIPYVLSPELNEDAFVIAIANCYNIQITSREALKIIQSINLSTLIDKLVSFLSKNNWNEKSVFDVFSKEKLSSLNLTWLCDTLIRLPNYYLFKKATAWIIIEKILIVVIKLIKMIIIFFYAKNEFEKRMKQSEFVKSLMINSMKCYNEAIDYFNGLSQ